MSDAPIPDEVRGTLPSHPQYLPLVRAMVTELANLAGIDRSERQAILLAVTEAWTNVIRHAYGGDTARRIDFRMSATEGRLAIEIEDWGTWVDPSQIASRPLDEIRPGGLGVHLIHSTMDEVAYDRNEHGGTTLRLARAVTPAEDAS